MNIPTNKVKIQRHELEARERAVHELTDLFPTTEECRESFLWPHHNLRVRIERMLRLRARFAMRDAVLWSLVVWNIIHTVYLLMR